MIKLFVAVFLLVQGVQPQDPETVLSRIAAFETVQACEDFVASDAGKAEIEELRQALANANPTLDIALETACKPAE